MTDLATALLPVLHRSLESRYNVFDVMHHGTHEKQISNVFRWLLETEGNHHLGDMFLRNPTTVTIYGFLPVVPMVLGSALWMLLVSLLTRPPTKETIEKYFPGTSGSPDPDPSEDLS